MWNHLLYLLIISSFLGRMSAFPFCSTKKHVDGVVDVLLSWHAHERERVCMCVCFLRLWTIPLGYWWARPRPHFPWPSSLVLTPPVLVMPLANTCCKGSEEVETGWKGEYMVQPCVNRITFCLCFWSHITLDAFWFVTPLWCLSAFLF